MSSLTKIPTGVQYFFDDEVRLRRQIEQEAMKVFSGWSYDEIILPMFDYQDLFARGMGEEKGERTYRFVDRDGALLALRPELTTLVARTVATRFKNKPRPLRLSYSGEVFRYDDPAERAVREFHQIGIEHIGVQGIEADIEVLLVASEVLTTLGLKDFRIALSHVDFFQGVASFLGLKKPERAELRQLIDRRNKIELAGFLAARAQHIEESRRLGFCDLTQTAGKEEAIAKAQEIMINERSRSAIDHLSRIYSTLTALDLRDNFDIDLGDTGSQKYYTGLVFKVYVPEWGLEIGSGGRYDNLIGNFGASEPAIGFSFSLDGIAGAMANSAVRKRLASPPPAHEIDEMDDIVRTFESARQCRANAMRVKIITRNKDEQE